MKPSVLVNTKHHVERFMKQQNTKHELSVQAELEQSPQKSPKRSIFIFKKLGVFFMIWVSLVLMYGVICSYTNEVGQDEFYRFIFFLRSPVVVVINCLALILALLHTVTWFNSVPTSLKLVNHNQRHFRLILIAGLWLVTLVISMMLFLFVLK